MPRPLPLILAATAITIAVGGGIAWNRTHHTSRPESRPIPTAATIAEASKGPGSEPEAATAPAVAAALRAVRSTGQIAKAGFISRTDLIASIATTAFAPRLTATTAAQLAVMTVELGAANVTPADMLWAETPLRVRTVTATDARAVVEVWTVLVVGLPGGGATRQAWRTITLTLVRERDAWRISDWATVAGPTPALAPTAAISDVASVAGVVGWSAVGGA